MNYKKCLSYVVFTAFLLICNLYVQSFAQKPISKTKLVILGVQHSPQLIAESYQPAVLRAYLKRVKPDAICIERSPQEFARNDFYEFTYEQQYLAIPFAKENKIPLYPIDWLPPSEDTQLAYNLGDLEKPGFTRNPTGFLGFVNFPDKTDLNIELFHAETEQDRNLQKQFIDSSRSPARFDFARRLYLYRTFMQAMRILRAANDNPGKTVLVIVGALHKPDIEEILKNERNLELIPSSSFGLPTAEEIKTALRTEDLFAIAAFNLLGTQAKTGNVNWDWLKRVVESLSTTQSNEETFLLKTRLEILTNKITSEQALENYRKISETIAEDKKFTWTGVKDASRIDSYFDPFGNLTIKQRAQIEMAREAFKLKRTTETEEILKRLQSRLSPTKYQQLGAYWEEYVLKTL